MQFLITSPKQAAIGYKQVFIRHENEKNFSRKFETFIKQAAIFQQKNFYRQ
jgi:hypothetical protein